MTESLLFLGRQNTIADQLIKIFRPHPELELYPCSGSAQELHEKIRRFQPRLILVGSDIPLTPDASELRAVLKKNGTPPVLFLDTPAPHKPSDLSQAALEWGALDILSTEVPHWQEVLLKRIELFLPLGRQAQRMRGNTPTPRPNATSKNQSCKLLLIGSSTGGPQALAEVLQKLPVNFSLPILLVQHLPPGFTASLAARLNAICHIQVREARDQELLLPGQALMVPGNQQVAIQAGGRLKLYQKEGFSQPSVDLALESAVKIFQEQIIAVILTGMGEDGLKGVRLLKQAGGYCLVEAASSSVIYGMPRAVAEEGLADRIIPLPIMAREILRRTQECMD